MKGLRVALNVHPLGPLGIYYYRLLISYVVHNIFFSFAKYITNWIHGTARVLFCSQFFTRCRFSVMRVRFSISYFACTSGFFILPHNNCSIQLSLQQFFPAFNKNMCITNTVFKLYIECIKIYNLSLIKFY